MLMNGVGGAWLGVGVGFGGGGRGFPGDVRGGGGGACAAASPLAGRRRLGVSESGGRAVT